MYRFGLGDGIGRLGWFRVGNLEVTTTVILVASSVISMFIWAAAPSALDPLFFSAPLVRDGEVWRLLTWPLGVPPSIWAVISLVFFWLFGHMVEDAVGRRRYLVLIAAMTLIPAALVSLSQLTAETSYGAAGVSSFGMAFFVSLAVKDPQRPSFFGIPIWVLAAVFVGISVLSEIGFRAWGSLILMLLTLTVAIVGTAMCGFIEADKLTFVPRLGDAAGPRSRGSRSVGRRSSGRGRRGRGKVVEGPWSSPGGFEPPKQPSRADSAELDALLDKISATGLDSLTPAERARLEDLRRGLRG